MNTVDSTYTLNFGPHHPSTHGLLRLVLELRGEDVIKCEPVIGYLHRGVEKILESENYISGIPYMDRIDYLAPLLCEHAYILAIENALKLNVPKRALFIRMIFDELTRISSHLMAIGSSSYDIGCLSLFLYALEEREKIMEIFELVTGARMHLCYYIPGGVASDIDANSITMIEKFLDQIHTFLKEAEIFAFENPIYKKRYEGVGIISNKLAKEYGLTGVNARASGSGFDIRKIFPYAHYDLIKFHIPTSRVGDSYSRMKLRCLEIIESVSIIRQCIALMPSGSFKNSFIPEFEKLNDNAAYQATYDLFYQRGFELPQGIHTSFVESPRGAFGVTIVSDKNSCSPYRIKIKSPSFNHINILEKLAIGNSLQDLTTILGSLDFLVSESDR